MKKTCINCHERKPLEDYYRDKKQPGGRKSTCKGCEQDRYRSKKRSIKDEWIRGVSELIRGWGP